MTKKPIFITGIGTGIGKTIISAIMVEKLKADYWKPIQSGDLENTDTDVVRSLVSNKISQFHPEAYRLTQAFSPHKSADLDGVEIRLDHIHLPKTDNQLIIEGAGGLMVPLNSQDMMIDLIQKFNAEVIVVVKHYLGSINHTLLTLEVLKSRDINIKGIIFNGNSDLYSERIIESMANVLGRIENIQLNKTTISELSNRIKRA